MRARSGVLISLVFLGVAQAQNAELTRAQAQMSELKFADAARSLEAAAKRQGNDRDTTLQIYELLGVTYASLNQGGKAVDAFRRMLVIDPTRKLGGDYAPRIMTPFYEARGWVGDKGDLGITLEAARVEGGRVREASVRVKADPLKLVRKVRFHLSADGAAWVEQDAPVAGPGVVATAVDCGSLRWWVEVLGEREMQLFVSGDADRPLVATGAPPTVSDVPQREKDAAALAPVAPVAPAAAPVAAAQKSTVVRPVGFGLLAGAVLAGVAGGYFGLQAAAARQEIASATVNDQGLTTSMTQVRAYQLDAQAKQSAVTANVLFGAAGALAVTGTVMVIAGGPSETKLSLAATPSGLWVRGTLP